MVQFCSECGIPLPENAHSCPSCGASALDRLLASHAIIPSVESPSPAEEEVPVAESSRGEEEAVKRTRERLVEPPDEGWERATSAPSEWVLSGEEGKVAENVVSVAEAQVIPPMTLADASAALRFLFDRRRILWYGMGTILGWMLFAIFHLLAYVAAESPRLAVAWRIGGWGAFIMMFALTSAVLAASLIAEVKVRLRLPWGPASGVLRRLPAVVGPAMFFAGIAGVGVLLLLALGILARTGARGRLLWALLFIPQFLLVLGVMLAGLGALAALVYGPALAMTDGGTFSQTLYRLYLLFTRDGKRAVGYLFLALAIGGGLGVLIQMGIGFVIRGIEHLALWASQGETAAVGLVGREVIAACVPGRWWFEGGEPAVPLRVEPDLRLAGFLWAISVIVLRGAGMVIPLLLVSGCGALATWILLGRLAQSSDGARA